MTIRAAICALTFLAAPAVAQDGPEPVLNDYPTEARADYVFGCMAANGQTPDALRRCSCSIDMIASILPYEDYVHAETVLSLRRTGGERMSIFRSTQMAKDIEAKLRRAQAEAEIVCFQ